MTQRKIQKTSRYFIALLPPEIVQNSIVELKDEFKNLYNSSASFNSPAHITLVMPFELRESKKEQLVFLLENFAKSNEPIDINQDGFGCFEPRVIFVNVKPDDPLLDLQKNLGKEMKGLQIFEKNYKNQAYRPHMTIAFRDLRKPQFYQAWTQFEKRKFTVSWKSEGVVLLKRNDKVWEIDHKFNFKIK